MVEEIWIGVIHLLPEGDRFALAWVRRHDEWLADASTAPRGDEIAVLARMYRDAVARRDAAPARINVRARAHADALRERLGSSAVIDVGFDTRAQELSDAAASAIDLLHPPDDGGPSAEREFEVRAGMYEAIERQLEEHDPPQVATTLERLEQRGLDRDHAMAAIARVFMRKMHDAMSSDQPFDTAGYAAALEALSPPGLQRPRSNRNRRN